MDNTTLGSSGWNSWKGFKRNEAFDGTKIVFGVSVPKDYDGKSPLSNLTAFSPKRHFLSVAPTRSGKGVSLIIPNLLQYSGSCIVIDPKGENAWITAKYRREGLGQKTFILDPWGEVNRRYGDLAGEKETIARFNPLSILDPKSPDYADDLAYLADAIIINQTSKDPFFDDSARALVAGLISYLVEKYGQAATLGMVRVLLTKTSADLADIAEEAASFGPQSLAARKLERFAEPSKTNANIISTALVQTDFLDNNALEENLSFSDFSFEDLTNKKATIYLVLPVDKLETHGRWLRLLISIGIRSVARNTRKLSQPVLFILDEFGTIGRLSIIAQAFGLMAGLQMCIWAFVQDLAQLQKYYSDDWQTFIGNSEAVTFFHVMDDLTATHFSKMLGKETVERISEKTAQMRKKDPEYSAMADSIYSRDLLAPDEIRRLSPNLAVALGRFKPMSFLLYLYYQYPISIERARHDPRHGEKPTPPKPRETTIPTPQKEEKESGFFAALKRIFFGSEETGPKETNEKEAPIYPSWDLETLKKVMAQKPAPIPPTKKDTTFRLLKDPLSPPKQEGKNVIYSPEEALKELKRLQKEEKKKK